MKQAKVKCDAVRILIAEDEPDVANLLLKQIEKSPSGCVSAEVTGTLAGALTAIGSEAFDLVILDLGLPDSKGVATLERIQHAAPETPVVVLTGLDDPAIGAKCIEMGAQNYLVKGCIGSAINGVIHNTMAAKSALLQAEVAHENLKRVLDNSLDAILVIEDDGRVMFANRTAKALFCGRVSEGQDMGLLLDSGETQELDVIQSGGSFAKVEMRTGETTWFGKPARIVSFRDITERATSEIQMAEQLDELRRWHDLTLGRETRVIELKREVNELLAKAGQPPRYESILNADCGTQDLEIGGKTDEC